MRRASWSAPARRGSRALAVLALALPVGMLLGGIGHYAANLANQQRQQKETLDLVHRLFPEAVPYIDRCSMVSTFPKVGFFMSSLGMRFYHERGEPIMEEPSSLIFSAGRNRITLPRVPQDNRTRPFS